MSAHDDYNSFDEADSGASKTTPVQCSALRKGGHVLIRGHPCKIVDMSVSSTGKHGHAKVNMAGVDIVSGKKYETICVSTHNMDVPNVKMREYDVVSIGNGGGMILIGKDNQLKEDFTLPATDMGTKIRTLFERDQDKRVIVTVLSTMDEEIITSVKFADFRD